MGYAADNKRIAKNTLMLYVRTLFMLFVSLYTSRMIFKALGQSDFGLYNVIGGVILLFTYIKNSMSLSSSRYMTFELGTGDIQRIAEVFFASKKLHLYLSVFIVALGETIGLWIVNYVLQIPEGREFAANVVYQVVVFSAVLTVLQVPYTTVVISYEKMSVYAYLGILTSLLHLGVAVAITYTTLDKLILYAILQLICSIISMTIVRVYCYHSYREVLHTKVVVRKSLLKEMMSFSGWSLFGSSVSMLRMNGVNILINIFFGTIVNSANAIANSVNHAVTGLTQNFITAAKPQITKLYASGAQDEMFQLVVRASKFGFYLLCLLCIPVIVEMDYLLRLWLGNPPEYAVVFSRLILAYSLVDIWAQPVSTAIQATGKIIKFQIVISSIIALVFPVSFLIYELGGPPYSAVMFSVFIALICVFIRLRLLMNLVNVNHRLYFVAFFKGISILMAIVVVVFLLQAQLDGGLLRLIIVASLSSILVVLAVLCIGLDNAERDVVKRQVYRMIGS